jgi:hypothetical protein
MHWSWPQGREFLVWLANAGGDGDAWNYSEITRRLSPNNGASSARRVLDAIGIPGAMLLEDGAAVRQFDGGATEKGRRVSIYRLRPDVFVFVRSLIRQGLESSLASEAMARATAERLADIYRQAEKVARARAAVVKAAGPKQTTLL